MSGHLARAGRRPRLVDLVHYDALHFGQRPALRIDGSALSYRDLERRVDETARALGARIKGGDRVAIWLPNSFSWIASFLALNALGAVSVPVNTRLTAAELAVLLRDARVRALITTEHYRGRDYLDEALGALTGEGMLVYAAGDGARAQDWRLYHDRGLDREPQAAMAEDLLCIQYTSGTSATPKGVMLTNHSYLKTAAYVARCQGLTPSSNFISAGPFFHCSGSMHAITVCLHAGCTLNSLSIWDPIRYLDEVQKYRCDVSHACFLRDVLALGAERARPKLASLRRAHALGTQSYLMRLHDELGIGGISNIYGMTETAGQFTMWFPDDPLEKRTTGNGRPQVGNELRIGNPETGTPLAPGSTGEIQMQGDTVTPGYFNRPDANADAFTSDGWLRSGDLGKLTEDGELVYLARLKEIIRVGGENLAPDEVEQAIRDLTGVQQVCVLGVPDARLDEVPAAVVVGAEDLDWHGILAKLRETLAGFKLPRAIYAASEFPKTATNKVRRAELKDWLLNNRLRRLD